MQSFFLLPGGFSTVPTQRKWKRASLVMTAESLKYCYWQHRGQKWHKCTDSLDGLHHRTAMHAYPSFWLSRHAVKWYKTSWFNKPRDHPKPTQHTLMCPLLCCSHSVHAELNKRSSKGDSNMKIEIRCTVSNTPCAPRLQSDAQPRAPH